EYFSLKRHPFRITPDPSLFFPGGTHGRGVVLDALVYGITTGEGILKVVGEVGSGKTMLCRMLEERLPPSIEIVYLANPNLTARDIVYAIAFELKLEVDSGTDRLLVMQKLQHYLLQKHAAGGSVVVFIEEAQGMPLETLEEIRLLSNLETHRHKLMQIVLFGQPELERKLQNRSIRQLRERITHSFELAPLTQQDVREYLHFRLQQAGCPWPQLFSPAAEKLLAAASGGLTRRVNILADKSLLAAYADPSMRQEPRNSAGEIQSMVLPRHVKTAIADSGYERWPLPRVPQWLVYGATAAAAGVVVALVGLYGGWFTSAPEQLPAAQTIAARSVSEVAQGAETTPGSTRTAEPAAGLAASMNELQQPALEQRAADEQQSAAEQAPQPAEEQQQAADEPQQSANELAADDVPQARSSAAPDALAQTSAALPANAVTLSNASTPGDAPMPANGSMSTNASAPGDASLPSATDIQSIPANTAPIATQSSGNFTAQRLTPSRAWLAQLAQNEGYTIQLYSVPTQQPRRLEEFLEYLATVNLLDRSYICIISGNERRPEQWLVMHDSFPGLSAARRFVEQLPPDLAQYQPYIRNLDDVACAE
ncbi:MAG: AAA family ATPase, partial [Gammaproteobacteria bacterium]